MALEHVQADYLYAMLGGRPRSAPAGAGSSAGAAAGASGATSSASSSAEAHARKLAAGIAQARWPAAGWMPRLSNDWAGFYMRA